MGEFEEYQEGRESRNITSEWVAPYNMKLLKLSNTHRNNDICFSEIVKIRFKIYHEEQ